MFSGPRPLAYYLPTLCEDDQVVSELKEHLKESSDPTDKVISQLKSGKASIEQEEWAADLLSDLVHNEATAETLFYASNGDDWFPITINEYAGVFWVWAPEFEEIGFFGSREDAAWEARFMDLGSRTTTTDPSDDPRM